MYTLTVFCFAVAAASAATPFFESPHNPHASAFYKTPANGGHYSGPPAPAYQPSSSYHSQPAPYRPAPAPYRPAPAPYQPSHGGYSSGGYGGQSSGGYGGHSSGGYGGHSSGGYGGHSSGGYGGHGGATSFQTVRLGGGGDYGHHGSQY